MKKYSSSNWSGVRKPLAIGMWPKSMNGSMEVSQIRHAGIGLDSSGVCPSSAFGTLSPRRGERVAEGRVRGAS